MEQTDVVNGYSVQKSVLFDNGKGMAMAENPAAPQPFVTWQFTQEEDGQRNYYWGHYFTEPQTALTDYAERTTTYQNNYGAIIISGEAPPKLIRFIDSQYNTLFTLPDGGNISITLSDGERLVRPCQYVDPCHTKVGSNIFHSCEFAEKMEAAGNSYAPYLGEKLAQKAAPQRPREKGGQER